MSFTDRRVFGLAGSALALAVFPCLLRAAPADAKKPADSKPEAKKDEKPAPDAKKDEKSSVDLKALEAHDKVRKSLRDLVGGVQSMAEFQERWKAKGPAFKEQVLGFLKEFPKYDEGNESMLDLAVRLSTRLQLDDLATEMLKQIRTNAADTPLGRKADEALLDLRDRTNAKALVGKEVDFSFVPVGETAKLELKSLRGKVVVLYFWAAWCDLCSYQTDELKKQYEKYNEKGKDKKLEIIGISLDDDQAKLQAAVKAAKIPWPQQYDGRLWSNEIARRFAIDSIPRVLVLDKAGRYVLALERREQLDELLAKLIEAEHKPAGDGKAEEKK